MACAAHGATRNVRWTSAAPPCDASAAPLFGANDNGDAPFRAVQDAARRLWRDHGVDSPFVAATRAQSAFWQGRMDACRWWNSVGRALDRALVAGSHSLGDVDDPELTGTLRQAPVNS